MLVIKGCVPSMTVCYPADGLITYMRTDSSSLEATAAHILYRAAARVFGEAFLADEPNPYMYEQLHSQAKTYTWQ